MRIRDSVVAITGASSGIGRAAALRLAASGAVVVPIARREHALRELEREVESRGERALAVTADVADEEALRRAARQAVERFGRLDAWVNNAGVTLFAPFEEAPMDVYRRVVETNYFGTVHGARAAIPYFREQGRGVLINNSSVFGAIGAPYLSAYISTKWAIRGLGEALRQELRGSGIRVCTLMPGSIDTPIFQHAANYTGRAIKAMDPVVDVDRVARAIVSLVRRPRRELIVGNAARMQFMQHQLAPGLTELLTGRQVKRNHFEDRPAPAGPGATLEPMPQHTSPSGGWNDGGGQAARIALGAGLAGLVGLALADERLRREARGLVRR